MGKERVKAVVNAVTLATPAGLLVALAGRCRVVRGPRGLLIATGYRLPVPPNTAFTVGNVVLTRREPGFLEARPRLLAHEERHSWQYVACAGLPMVPLYLLASGWSYLRTGDPASRNPFERLAGLEDGGYREVSARRRGSRGHPRRPRRRRRRAA